MPRYAYQKPRAKVYAYNFGYMNNYYKPMTHFLSKDTPSPVDRPGAQCLAERLKKFPMDGSIYPDKDVRYLPSASPPREIVRQVFPANFTTELEAPRPVAAAAVPKMQEEERKVTPLYLKHPYRLPVDDEVMPIHESSIWPKGRKHFDLVSSYDLMCGYLGLLSRRQLV